MIMIDEWMNGWLDGRIDERTDWIGLDGWMDG